MLRAAERARAGLGARTARVRRAGRGAAARDRWAERGEPCWNRAAPRGAGWAHDRNAAQTQAEAEAAASRSPSLRGAARVCGAWRVSTSARTGAGCEQDLAPGGGAGDAPATRYRRERKGGGGGAWARRAWARRVARCARRRRCCCARQRARPARLVAGASRAQSGRWPRAASVCSTRGSSSAERGCPWRAGVRKRRRLRE